jgi:hypothetical protein
VELEARPIEFRKFFYNDFLRDYGHLKAFRTEWRIFDEDSFVAGSIDMIFRDPNDPHGFLIYDWKRNKEIEKLNLYGKFAHEPITHVADNNYWHHVLQLSMYRYMLEKCYGMKINGHALICLHPINTTYLKFETPYLKKEIESIVEYRKQTCQWILFLRKHWQTKESNKINIMLFFSWCFSKKTHPVKMALASFTTDKKVSRFFSTS